MNERTRSLRSRCCSLAAARGLLARLLARSAMAASLKQLLKQARESIDKKEYTTAVQHCRAGLKLEPTNYTLLVFAGVACFHLNQLEHSEQVGRRSVAAIIRLMHDDGEIQIEIFELPTDKLSIVIYHDLGISSRHRIERHQSTRLQGTLGTARKQTRLGRIGTMLGLDNALGSV